MGRRIEPKTIAIEVLAELLGGGATGILHRRLVMERRLAADVSASYDPAAIDETMFAINAIPKPGVTMEELERAIDEEINDFAKTLSTTPADLTRAKQKLIMAGSASPRWNLQSRTYSWICSHDWSGAE